MNNVKKKALDMYLFLFLLLTILFSRNTLISSCIFGFNISFFIIFLVSLPLIFVYAYFFIKGKTCRKNDLISGVLVVSIIFSILIKIDFRLFNFSLIFYIINSYIYVQLAGTKKIIIWFEKIMLFLAVYSLITEFVVKPITFRYNLSSFFENSGLFFSNASGNKFLNTIFGFSLFSVSYTRNFGIFNEPSYFQFYLMFALIIALFLKNYTKKSYIYVMIFLITMFTTASAAAYVIMIAIILTFILKQIIDKNFKKKDIIIISAFTGILH